MRFRPLTIPGGFAIELERLEDSRGSFARSYCQDEFEKHGLDPAIAQCSLSWNRQRGTLRGMHFQISPHEETKVVRCIRGAIYDVIVDLRRDSPTYLRWEALQLDAAQGNALYIPAGCGHGFQTLCDDTEILYQISVPYSPGHARGVRWNDPAVGIEWPLPEPILSDRDASFPDIQL